MIFTVEQTAGIRAGRITATIIPASKTAPKPDTVTPLWRRHTRHDEDGNELDSVSGIVYDTQSDRPDQPIQLTIQAVHKDAPVDALTQLDAHACGYKTAAGLQDAWKQQHPRTQTVHIIRFSVGDLRDRGRYIAWTGRAGGDYTTNPRRAADDAEALQAGDVAQYAKRAREQDRQRRQNPDQKLRDDLVKALEDWELAASGNKTKDHLGAIRGIRRQLAVLDRKLKAA